MPSKQASKDQTASPLGSLLAAAEAPAEQAPPGYPPTGSPDTDQDDDDQDDVELPPPNPPHGGTSRRGFLGAAAAVVAGAAAAAAPQAAAAAPVEAPAQASGMTPTMEQMAAFFTQLMDQRDATMLAELDRRVSAIRAELPVPNGVATAPAEMAARPGEYPPAVVFQQPTYTQPEQTRIPVAPATSPWPQPAPEAIVQPRQPRMVAFIPKEDPYNPRQTMFRGWVNGRELRARRGQIMIVSLGTGVDWAKNGHGNCVDIAAMQGVGTVEPLNVPQQPDFSRPSNWDGMPLNNRSSIPIHGGLYA